MRSLSVNTCVIRAESNKSVKKDHLLVQSSNSKCGSSKWSINQSSSLENFNSMSSPYAKASRINEWWTTSRELNTESTVLSRKQKKLSSIRRQKPMRKKRSCASSKSNSIIRRWASTCRSTASIRKNIERKFSRKWNNMKNWDSTCKSSSTLKVTTRECQLASRLIGVIGPTPKAKIIWRLSSSTKTIN